MTTSPTYIGYARVSTFEQHLDLQLDALRKAGVEEDHLFTDKVSGTASQRPGLDLMKKVLRKGDVLVVWRLDRLGRNVQHLAGWMAHLREKDIGFKSITEGVDTQTPGGRLVYHMFAAVAEFERDLTVERTLAGLAAARARGRKGGRKPKIDPKKLISAKALMRDGNLTVAEVAQELGVGQSTLYRALRGGRSGVAADDAAAALQASH